MTQIATCGKYGFGFLCGHSHHARESCCICLTCLSCFGCPTKSEWGPEIGEVIPVCRIEDVGKGKRRKTKLVPTGISFISQHGDSFISGDQTAYYESYSKEPIPCPDCGAHTLSFWFSDGALCPICKSEVLQIASIII